MSWSNSDMMFSTTVIWTDYNAAASVRAQATPDWLECAYCGTQQRYEATGQCRACGAGRQHSRLPKNQLHR